MKEKEYKSEEEFLKDYDSNRYEKLSITTDILIMSVSTEKNDNYRKLSDKKFSVLLVKRKNYPFKDKWCLPGGFVNMDETLDDAAKRILKDETNLKNIYMEQLYTFSDINRDPRMRIISTAYMALIDKNRLDDKLYDNVCWFNIESVIEVKNQMIIVLENGDEIIEFTLDKKLIDTSTDKYNYEIKKNDKLAFDHPLVIGVGLDRLKNKIEYTDIVFNMMPKTFTIGELQKVYEVILNKRLLPADFRRRIADKIEKVDGVLSGKGHRPSNLYKYKRNN